MPMRGKEIHVGFTWPVCSMGLFINQLVKVTCREWAEYWLFTVKGKQALEIQTFAISLLKRKSFSCLQWKRNRRKERTVCQMDTGEMGAAGNLCTCPSPGLELCQVL